MTELMVVIGLFTLFFVTILKELKLFTWVGDRFPISTHFIPSWSFFAPNPYQTDYFILYRCFSQDSVSEWQQAYHIPKKRAFYSCFWNPDKIFLKSVVDIAIDLLRISGVVRDNKLICLSLPYLHALNFVQSLAVSANMEKIQFVIMTRTQNEVPMMMFLSEAHPVKTA